MKRYRIEGSKWCEMLIWVGQKESAARGDEWKEGRERGSTKGARLRRTAAAGVLIKC